jgi:hypothetical protein
MIKLSRLFILLLLTTTSSFAGGVVTVQGKLVSITDTDYVIETSSQVFSIKRSAVTKDQASKMEHTEIPVSVTVPFNAIDRVQAKKK